MRRLILIVGFLLVGCASDFRPDSLGVTVFSPDVNEMSGGEWDQTFFAGSLSWNLQDPPASDRLKELKEPTP